MRPQSIIARKRDGKTLDRDHISAFVSGVTDGSWADYQVTAMLMAMFLNGLDAGEQSLLTRAMLESGETLDFSEVGKPVSDKHSTGGVGDKTSLIIAPLVASCGVAVPMISGRGLGHTGGTLDKLESIKGYNVRLNPEDMKRIVGECGFAMSGQTENIAPADKRIYSLRDATATVPSIPLIVASIMSKKLAEGLDSLVLDVKTGNGAFMEAAGDSRRLAQAMVDAGAEFGVKTQALITDMSQPLGQYVGNALEVYECIRILRNDMPGNSAPLVDLSMELSARMLMMSGGAGSTGEAKELLGGRIEDGSALDTMRENLKLQGGDESICDDPDRLIEKGLVVKDVNAETGGVVVGIDTKAIGFAVCGIGGGRIKADDDVDGTVGYECRAVLGSSVTPGDSLGVLYCRTKEQFEGASSAVRNAYQIREEGFEAPRLVSEVVE